MRGAGRPCVLAGGLWLAAVALAQAPPPNAPPEPAPRPPSVQDPMLAPVPPPPRVIASWQEALELLRSRSTDLEIARAEVERAAGQSRVALAAVLPTLQGTAVGTYPLRRGDVAPPVTGGGTGAPSASTNLSSLGGTLVLALPLVDARAVYGVGSARQAQRTARLDQEETQRLLSLGLAQALVGVVTAERVSELDRVGLRDALERLQLAERRTRLGAGTELDVVRARRDAEAARQQLVLGDETLRRSREALGLALGIPGAVGLPPGLDVAGLEATARSVCAPLPELRERSDLRAQRSRVAESRRGVTDAWLELLPTLGVQTAASTTRVDLEPGAVTAHTWTLQAFLRIPFYDGGARYGRLRRARAEVRQDEQRLVALERRAEVELAQSRRAVEVADQALAVARSERELAAETERLVRRAFELGRGTSLDLVTAATALRQAELTLAVREFDAVQARLAALFSAANCPW